MEKNIIGSRTNTSFAKIDKLPNSVPVVPKISNPALQNADIERNAALNNPSTQPYLKIILGARQAKPTASIIMTIFAIFLIRTTIP